MRCVLRIPTQRMGTRGWQTMCNNENSYVIDLNQPDQQVKKQIEKKPDSNMDGGWKEIIKEFTEEFFRFFLPEMHKSIDFSRKISFLDKELNEIISDSDNIKREADLLLEVYLKDGIRGLILIHLEVQSYKDDSFQERMYVYNYRIYDKYRKKVVSIALLIDNSIDYRPGDFILEQFNCAIHFTFPIIKLLDFADAATRENEKKNPFSIVTRIQLAKLQSENNPDKRYSFRMELTKELYAKQYRKEEIIRLYRFIDYILKLPKPKALQFKKELAQFEEARKMPYITSTERLAREEGIYLGIEQGIGQGETQGQIKEARKAVLKALEVRFEKIPDSIRQQILFCDDLHKLEDLLTNAIVIASVSDFEM